MTRSKKVLTIAASVAGIIVLVIMFFNSLTLASQLQYHLTRWETYVGAYRSAVTMLRLGVPCLSGILILVLIRKIRCTARAAEVIEVVEAEVPEVPEVEDEAEVPEDDEDDDDAEYDGIY